MLGAVLARLAARRGLGSGPICVLTLCLLRGAVLASVPVNEGLPAGGPIHVCWWCLAWANEGATADVSADC